METVQITALRQDLTGDVLNLMDLGRPYISARTPSDYWLYAKLFSSTCPVALVEGTVAGAVIAMRGQDDPSEVYIQDVATHPDHRRRGIATALVGVVRQRAERWGCRRLSLTSEPGNTAAYAAWTAMGFTNSGTSKAQARTARCSSCCCRSWSPVRTTGGPSR
jgi:ribosomal protein S18 acetylase RimI-like enzyme